jgi:murein DD-endopeptidase MepM/ murein hydrolase activator NlpD
MNPWPIIVALVCAAGLASAQDRGPGGAAVPSLELPIACAIPDRCFIEFYVDRLEGPPVGDYRCGNRSYDTHRGTDFRVRAPQDLAAGVPVQAAADGTVVAARDGMQDVDVLELGRDKVAGRAGGNLVVLRHDDGWITLYWHMRRGSIAVREGQRVSVGQQLGLVGLSGDTNFPHLHFEVRHERQDGPDQVIDPFSGTDAATACGDKGRPLWSAAAMDRLVYRGVEVNAGFAAADPKRNDAVYGRLGAPPQAGSSRLFFWFELFGVENDDVVSVQFVLPDGSLRKPAQMTVAVPVSYLYRSAGLEIDAPLPAGRYGAILSLQRHGQPMPTLQRRFDFDLK